VDALRSHGHGINSSALYLLGDSIKLHSELSYSTRRIKGQGPPNDLLIYAEAHSPGYLTILACATDTVDNQDLHSA
jgi:hypothetical protein